MARPMVLMQEGVLHSLHLKHIQGVPVLALMRQHKLEDTITAPTLTKLLSYAKAMQESETVVMNIIRNSLFPVWLTNSKTIVASCPSEYYYTGKMPLGKWVKRGEEQIVVKAPVKAMVKTKQVTQVSKAKPVKKGKPHGKA